MHVLFTGIGVIPAVCKGMISEEDSVSLRGFSCTWCEDIWPFFFLHKPKLVMTHALQTFNNIHLDLRIHLLIQLFLQAILWMCWFGRWRYFCNVLTCLISYEKAFTLVYHINLPIHIRWKNIYTSVSHKFITDWDRVNSISLICFQQIVTHRKVLMILY